MTGLKKYPKEQRTYYFCLLLLPLIVLLALLYQSPVYYPSRFMPPCLFRSITGFSCPGCGCTRAVEALLRGHIFQSLRFNPLIFYCFFLYLAVLLSHTAERLIFFITKKLPSFAKEGSPFHILTRIHGMKIQNIHLMILVYLFLGFGALRLLLELWQHWH
ncbi:MAG: DUF2752 domain-containing protein [Lachnospiraceae bacterium]|nr:DUF2752 domain-containing protein [Lachnospiraceae bacterium]